MPTAASRTFLLAAVVLLALAPSHHLASQTHRALLVGINTYERFAPAGANRGGGDWVGPSGRELIHNLEGSVNDAQAMRDLLRARFGFDSAHIRLLEDTAATRAHIIDAIRQLTEEAQPGDVVVVFYAGHGSQRVNSLSRPTKLDQTIVPADANAGVFDIRNKELARLFTPLVEKGVALTLIFDSCHSGGITRGISVAYRERWAARDPRDAADSVAAPPPESRGALVISATQDYQQASETVDQEDHLPHGVFTSALLSVLRSAAPDEPATRIFQRVKAIMQSTGRPQEPVLAGRQRERQPLLGGVPGATQGGTTVAVLRLSGERDVELQGGLAVGLREDAELTPFGRRPDAAAIRLRVTKVLGLSRSTAEVIQGSRDSIHPGNLFEIDKWAPPPAAGLRVWMPSAGLDASTLPPVNEVLNELRTESGIEVVADPTEVPADSTPLAVLQWREGGWLLEIAGHPAGKRLQPLTARAVEDALRQVKRKVRLFAFLPPSRQLMARLELGRGTRNDLVEVAADRGKADYLLVGRVREGHVEYAWMRPNASREMANSSTLPIRTDWIDTNPGVEAGGDSTAGVQLDDLALRLAKIRSWLDMEGPPDRGRFPYHLALREPGTGELRTAGPVYDGAYFGLVLRADSAQLKPSLERRWIYVFLIDSHGKSVLLFPTSNVFNRLPYQQSADGKWPTVIALGEDSAFSITPPFGMDTYVLLTSDEVVPTDALEWDGVQRRTRGGASPLAGLLFGNSGATRAGAPVVPLSWSIERLSILSAPQPPKRED